MKSRVLRFLVLAVIGTLAGWLLLSREVPSPSASQTPAPGAGSGPDGPQQPATNVGQEASSVGGAAARTLPFSESAASKDWDVAFQQSSDLTAFVDETLDAAIGGNARAQYYIGRAVRSCLGIVGIYGKEPDPRARFEQVAAEWKAPPNLIDSIKNNKRKEFERCQGFFSRDVFAALPERKGGYPHSYWTDLAVQNRDPLAMAERAASLIGQMRASPGANISQQGIQEPRDLMRAAVLSRDARAIYSVGLALNSSGFPGDGLNSVALMLAACQTGFDCSAANPEYGGSCVADGTCVEGERFEDMLQKNMGGETYARVFALAAEFRSALERHDSAAIEKFLARK